VSPQSAPREIERAFVPDRLPSTVPLGPGTPLRQGYVAGEDDVEVRLRIAPDGAVLTVKAGGGLSRTEVEFAIDAAAAEALWPHTAGRRIVKTRHRVPVADGDAERVAEVDVYADALAGLCRIEVEFASEDEAVAFVPPGWFGREVTGEVAWSNASLARHGRPDT
jgi:adenylate cyclase